MSSDIHIKDDNKNLQSPKLNNVQFDFKLNEGFSTPPRTKKGDKKERKEPKTPKKNPGKLFFNGIIERRKSDLFDICNNSDEGSLPSSPTVDIQSIRIKKKEKKSNAITSYFNSTKANFNLNNELKSKFNTQINTNLKAKRTEEKFQQNVIPPPLVKPNLSVFNKALKQTKLTFNSKANNDNNNNNDESSNEKTNDEICSDTDTINSFDSFTNSTDNDSSFLFFNSSDNRIKNNKNNILCNLLSETVDINENKNLLSINENSKFIKKKHNEGILKRDSDSNEGNFYGKKDFNLLKRDIDIFNLNIASSNNNVTNNDLSDKFKLFNNTGSPTFELNIFEKKHIDNNKIPHSFTARNIFESELLSEDFDINDSLKYDNIIYNFSQKKLKSKFKNKNKNKNCSLQSNTHLNKNLLLSSKKKIDFSNETWKNICHYLSYKEILTLSCLSKHLNSLIYELDIWKKIDLNQLSTTYIKDKIKFLEGLLTSKYSLKVESIIFDSNKNMPTSNIISLLINNCKNIKTLILTETNISINHFQNNFGQGKRLNSLKYLNISNCNCINYPAMKNLINGCPNIQKFECSNINLKSGEYSIIQELPHLQYLNVSGNKNLCNLDIKAIYSKENKIKYLDISYCSSLTDRAISFILKNAQSLETIKINGSNLRITQKSFYLLTDLKIRNIEFQKKSKSQS